MRKLLKIISIIVGGLILLLVLAAIGVYIVSGNRINKKYTINPPTVPVPTDAAAIAEGKRLVTLRGCNTCHGENMGGKVLIDGVPGHIIASNLTKGNGGIGNNYSDGDWVRAIRHGVDKTGRGIWIMPSDDFWKMSDADLGKIIAYVKSVPPVDHALGESSFGLLFRTLLVTGQGNFIAAEKIDHNAVATTPPPGVTLEYGQYVATNCQGCHGANLAGGIAVQPGSPASANLTPSGALKEWSETQFITAIRTGKLPNGRQLDNIYMPWQSFAQFTDDELKALWLYIQSLPPTPMKG
jgi:mono/diheme cytochrome c family protein